MMTIDALEAFVSVARLGSFSRTADSLHRSQPAISRRVSLLEESLGAPLFERVGGGVRLSEPGQALLPHAERALAAVRDGRAAVSAMLFGDAGRVSLAMVGTLADSHLVGLLRGFADRNPGVEIGLRTANSREVSDLVRTGEVTLGLRYYHDPHPDLLSRVVAREPLYLLAAPDNPLAGKTLADAEALRGQTWLAFPATRGGAESAGPMLHRTLAQAGLAEIEVMEVDSLTAQKRLAEAGFGIAMLPASSVREELRRGSLLRIYLPGLAAANPIAVVHRRDGFLSHAAESLLELFESILWEHETGTAE